MCDFEQFDMEGRACESGLGICKKAFGDRRGRDVWPKHRNLTLNS
jgi:hypothetical protein